jgi:cytochrome c-type biogenesis protein CcmH/NrfG
VRAAAASRDQKKAADYYAQLMKLCSQADSGRAELERAKAFLAKK